MGRRLCFHDFLAQAEQLVCSSLELRHELLVGIILEIKRLVNRVPKHTKDGFRHFCFFQLHNGRSQTHKHFIPEQIEFVMLRDSELSQPTADGIDPLGRAAAMLVEHILDLQVIQVFNGLAELFTYYDPAQRKQRANRRLTIMYAAPAILQQRASSLGSVGEQMDNGDMGVAADICFSIIHAASENQ